MNKISRWFLLSVNEISKWWIVWPKDKISKWCGLSCPGLTAVVGECQAGYYCPDGSIQDTEVVCPDGSYCPSGSGVPTDCPNGTYSNQTGLASTSQCTPCLEGYYCNGFGLTTVSGPCREGERAMHFGVVAMKESVETLCETQQMGGGSIRK